MTSRGTRRAPRPAASPHTGYIKLAAAVLADGITALRESHALGAVRPEEVDFFLDPKRSAVWCELAGFDWDAVTSRLKKEGLLVRATGAPPLRAGAKPRDARTRKVGDIHLDRVRAKLPRSAATACCAADLCASLGIRRQHVEDSLNILWLREEADYVDGPHPRRHQMVHLWYRV